ncbi:hypothetical protein AAFO92_19930 [Roseovarius sp. CAU 1744]
MDAFGAIAQPLTGITYPAGTNMRGIRDNNNDSALITGDGFTLRFSLASGSGFVDGFRIHRDHRSHDDPGAIGGRDC